MSHFIRHEVPHISAGSNATIYPCSHITQPLLPSLKPAPNRAKFMQPRLLGSSASELPIPASIHRVRETYTTLPTLRARDVVSVPAIRIVMHSSTSRSIDRSPSGIFGSMSAYGIAGWKLVCACVFEYRMTGALVSLSSRHRSTTDGQAMFRINIGLFLRQVVRPGMSR